MTFVVSIETLPFIVFNVCNELQRSSHSRDSSISKIRKTSDAVKREKGDITLLEYPMLFWMDHARDASDDIVERFDVNEGFFHTNSTERQIWFSAYWAKTNAEGENSPGAFTGLHRAAYAGLSLLLKLLDSDYVSDIHARDSLGNQPLLWAAKNGHDSAVRHRLERGAHVATRNNAGVTAL